MTQPLAAVALRATEEEWVEETLAIFESRSRPQTADIHRFQGRKALNPSSYAFRCKTKCLVEDCRGWTHS